MWQHLSRGTKKFCGHSDPSVLEGTFLEEVHGHCVTLAPFGAVMCVSVGALSKQARDGGTSSWCGGNVGEGVWLAQLSIDGT